jgi:4-hydroxybenzoate polyprenyltransferase
MAMRKALLFLDLARGRSALFSLSEPVLGAMLAGRAIPSVRVSLLGLLAALAGYFCVYSLNDLLDLKADREDLRLTAPDPQEWKPEVVHMDIMTLRHPVAAGALPLWAAATWVGALGVIGLAAAYLLRPLCAWLFIACALLQVLYCSLRHRTWLKVVPASTMVALGALAGWFAVGKATWGAFAFFFLLFGWEMFGRNLSNDLADVSHDRGVGITTLASIHGTDAAVRTIVTGAALMPLIGAVQPGPWISRLLLALAALATMTVPAALLARGRGTEPAAQRYFNRATLFPPAAAACMIVLALVHSLRG